MKLRAYLDERGETLEAFSARCGLSMASLSRLARGEQFPSRASAERIGGASGGLVTASDFMAAPAEPEPAPIPQDAA